MRRLLREQEQTGAAPVALTILRDANTGAGQDFTALAAAVQLRLRVAIGLQALQRCSGLLNRRARGSTVATHQLRNGVMEYWIDGRPPPDLDTTIHYSITPIRSGAA